MYNKTIIEFGFCDIRNNQGLGKYNQPRTPASADYTCLDRTLIIPDITKTSSNYCLLFKKTLQLGDVTILQNTYSVFISK